MTATKRGIPIASKPVELTWQITNACNLNCIECYGYSTPHSKPNEFGTQEAFELADRLIEEGILVFLWQGGDPFMRADFVDLLGHISPYAASLIWTNGTLITRQIAEALARYKVMSVFVNLQGATAETHESITRCPGSFNATIEGINNLVASGVYTVATFRLMAKNIHEIDDYIDLTEKLKVNKCNFIQLYPIGRAREQFATLAPSLDIVRLKIEEASKRSSPILEIAHPFYPDIHNCCRVNCCLLSEGDVTACSYLSEVITFGNIRNHKSLMDIWNSEAYQKLRSTEVGGKCSECLHSCSGGCRAMAVMRTGDWSAPDPSCWFTPKR